MKQYLESKYPCRNGFIKNLIELISNKEECFPPAIFVYGNAGTGKTAIVKDFLRVAKKENKIHGVHVNCVDCYISKILFENILDKLLYNGEENPNLRCETLKEFVEILRNVNKSGQDEGYVVALDNADRLRDMDVNIIPSFLRLQEMTGLNICVILISQIPFEKYYTKTGLTEVILLHCPQYSKSETLKILSEQFDVAKQILNSHIKEQHVYEQENNSNKELEKQLDIINKINYGFFINYLNVFLSVFYKACRDVPELKITACNCFITYMEPVLNGSIEITDISKLWRNVAAPLRTALSCVYMRYDKSVKNVTGLFGSKRQIIFTSEDSHYSVEKLAMFMGLGSENVCKIKTNEVGKIDIEDLKNKIELCVNNNCEPMMISATSGTTVLGAFDDLNSIADLCNKHGMWMHVDAAWGGGALMSPKYRHLLSGIERADSVTWNPHKMLTASQQCSTFLTRHKDILSSCHSTNATYLFQKDKFYDTSYDTGDKHIQCGRRADVFKFWFMWKAKGTKGLEEHVNQLFKMSEFLTKAIRERSGFELVLDKPECTNISFWYLPPSLRDMERNEKFYSELHKVAPKIKEGMIKKGSMMVTYQPLHNLPNFFRIVLQNSCLTEKDMIYFLDEIESIGNNL